MKKYNCSCCGANILIREDMNFTNCLYCGNTIVIKNENVDNLNVKKIIPFSVEKEEAIQNFKKIINKEVVDAKKIYVPVRFSNFDFYYLYFFQYKIETSDSDGGSSCSYHDKKVLVNGKVKDEIVFGNSKIKNIYMPYELRYQKRLDYNPKLLDDVSIELSNFDDDDYFTKEENKVRLFSNDIFSSYDICEVYSENYFITDIDIDSFSTLIPVYIIKTSDNTLYNIPGVTFTKYKKIINKYNLDYILLFIFFSIIPIALIFFNLIGGAFLSIAFVIFLFFYSRKYNKKMAFKYVFDNYSYKSTNLSTESHDLK